jgi:hypothetical protein
MIRLDFRNFIVVILMLINLSEIGYGQNKFKFDEKNIIASSYIDFITPYDNIRSNLNICCGITYQDYKFETIGNLMICKVPIYDLWVETKDISKNSILNFDNKTLEKFCLNFLYKENANLGIINDSSILKPYLIDPEIVNELTQSLINKIEQSIDSSKYYWEFNTGDSKYNCMIYGGSKYRYSTSHTVPYYLDYDSVRKNNICIIDQSTKAFKWVQITDNKELITEDGIILKMRKIYLESELLKQLRVLNKFCAIAKDFKFYGIIKEH